MKNDMLKDAQNPNPRLSNADIQRRLDDPVSIYVLKVINKTLEEGVKYVQS